MECSFSHKDSVSDCPRHEATRGKKRNTCKVKGEGDNIATWLYYELQNVVCVLEDSTRNIQADLPVPTDGHNILPMEYSLCD